jgi:hypothetical protein
MKTNLDRLSLINVDLFYCITIWQNEITLQGNMSSELVKYCADELKIELKTNEYGWLSGSANTIELGNLKITLT